MVDTRGDLSASRQECAGLKSSIAQLTAAQAGVNAELSATKVQLKSLFRFLSTGLILHGAKKQLPQCPLVFALVP